MSIVPIEEHMWNDILQLQNEAYFDITPEPLAALKSKWISSQETCVVYSVENQIAAYLLTHGWSGDELPKLNQVIEPGIHSTYLFIHDLVVSKRFAGLGIGASMVDHVIGIANAAGFSEARLIAVQDSAVFWQKMGFVPNLQLPVCSSYGTNAKAMYRDIIQHS